MFHCLDRNYFFLIHKEKISDLTNYHIIFHLFFVYHELILKCFNSYLLLNKIGITLSQYRVYRAFSVPLLTAQIQLQSRGDTCNISGLSSTEAGFSPNTSCIPCQL